MNIDINQREYDKFDQDNRVKTTTDSQTYDKLIDEASSTIIYIGECAVGSAGQTDQEIWRIKKVDQTSGIKITYANGSSDFNKKWTERATYTY